MKVIFVGGGPGDPELLTIKAERLLRNCRCCIYAGSLISPQVLALVPAAAEKHDSAGLTLAQTIRICRKAKLRKVNVVRLHSGDPSIYGAIQEQMKALEALGIDYEVVPGVSSFLAAAASLRQELTLPGVSQTVILTRLGEKTPVPEKESLKTLAESRATLCLFLSAQQLKKAVEELLPFYGADCPAAVIYKSTWKEEKIIRAPLSELAQKTTKEGIKKTALVIVGWVLASTTACGVTASGSGPATFERSRVYQSR